MTIAQTIVLLGHLFHEVSIFQHAPGLAHRLIERAKQGGSDEEILQWCFSVGRKPSDDEVYVWNEFMRKRGWNDEVSETLKRRKQEAGMADRSDIQTAFQFIDADEGRLPKNNHG